MCYNCGCDLPDEDHGKGHAGAEANGKSITSKTFEAAGEAFGMSQADSKKNTRQLLSKEDL